MRENRFRWSAVDVRLVWLFLSSVLCAWEIRTYWHENLQHFVIYSFPLQTQMWWCHCFHRQTAVTNADVTNINGDLMVSCCCQLFGSSKRGASSTLKTGWWHRSEQAGGKQRSPPPQMCRFISGSLAYVKSETSTDLQLLSCLCYFCLRQNTFHLLVCLHHTHFMLAHLEMRRCWNSQHVCSSCLE